MGTIELEFGPESINVADDGTIYVGGEGRVAMLSADGKVVKKYPVKGFPAFHGMSVAGKRLFIATRDGKLICFEGK